MTVYVCAVSPWPIIGLWLAAILFGLLPCGLYAVLGGRAAGIEPLILYGLWCIVVTVVAAVLIF